MRNKSLYDILRDNSIVVSDISLGIHSTAKIADMAITGGNVEQIMLNDSNKVDISDLSNVFLLLSKIGKLLHNESMDIIDLLEEPKTKQILEKL